MRKLVILLSLVALAGMVSAASAKDDCGPAVRGDPGCCARCERHAPCQKKTCQVVCEMKKEKKHKWAVECVEFCPLLPGCKDRSRDPGCGDPGCADPGQGCGGQCGDPCRSKGDPPPRCGRPKCIKKLVKKEYEVEVPVYKCVVQYLCDGCCKSEPAAPAAGPAPKAAASPPLPPVPPAPPAPANRNAAQGAPQGGRESSPTAAIRFVGG